MNPAALVTGASRGIGRAIAIELARAGWDVLINYVSNADAARQTASDCLAAARKKNATVRAETSQADISREADRLRLVESMRATFGRIDLLVNNAGVAPAVRADLLEASEASFDRVLAINLKGPYFLTQTVANWMIDLSRSSDGTLHPPKIVTISSVSAYTASVNRGDYCVAKAGLGMMTKLFATRLAEFGIGVYEIRPGIIETDMTAAVKEKYDQLIAGGLTPIQRWGRPEDVARAVLAIAENCLPFSTGEVINVDGGFHLQRL